MRNSKIWLISCILVVGDAILFYAAFRLAVLARQSLSPLLGRPLLMDAIGPMVQLGFLLGFGIFLLQGLYPGFGLTAVKELERVIKAVSLVFFLLAGISYLNKPFQDVSRSVLLIAWVLALAIIPLARFILRNLLSRFSWYGIPVVIFGDGEWARQVTNSFEQVPRLGWRPKAIFPIREIADDAWRLSRVGMVIVAASRNESLDSYVRILSQQYRKIIVVRQTDYFGSLWVETRDLDGRLGLEYSYHLLSRRAIRLKRLIDILIALLLLLAISPFFVLLAVVIVIDSPGPVIYRQQRLGQNGRLFWMLKLRTMVANAETELERLLSENPTAWEEYDKFHKIENDPRVTRVGKLLRRFSLDEFPQLWNVLKGEMSLAGPRAYLPSELEEIGDYAQIILRVNPGITGWWQVLGRHQTTFRHRLQMDEYYISNWSLWMDIYILLKTFVVVLKGKGV